MKGKSKKSRPKKSGMKRSRPKPINFRPIATLAVIALLMIAFIYWSERTSAPARKAKPPVKQAAVSVKPKAVPVKQKVVPVKREPAPVKRSAEPVKVASVVPVKPVVTEKPAVRPTIVEKISEKLRLKARKAKKVERVEKPEKTEEVKRAEKAAPLIPPAVTVRKRAKIAIVLDDFGYSMNNVDAVFDLNMPVTLAILPNQRYSRKIAEKARSRGYEVILHLPMESWRQDAKEEEYTIRSGMSQTEIEDMLNEDVAFVPGLSGMNNHQGSKATEDREVMAEVMRYLKKKNLYFFDSFTTAKSVCREVAAETDVKFARRNKFLDNENNAVYIEKQLVDLKVMALARGKAIAIGHDRKTTIAVLAKVMPEMVKEGIDFVYLSEMVK